MNRHDLDLGPQGVRYQNFMQTDAAIISIPINMAMRIVTDLIDFGRVQRGFLGVSLDATYNHEKAAQIGLSASYGALISAITCSRIGFASRRCHS